MYPTARGKFFGSFFAEIMCRGSITQQDMVISGGGGVGARPGWTEPSIYIEMAYTVQYIYRYRYI